MCAAPVLATTQRERWRCRHTSYILQKILNILLELYCQLLIAHSFNPFFVFSKVSDYLCGVARTCFRVFVICVERARRNESIYIAFKLVGIDLFTSLWLNLCFA